MDPALLPGLIGMALAASWTPGPNNSMLASSGATHGLRATVPHILGISLGFPVMIFLVALGLGQVFQQSALLREALRWIGAAMLLWMAWRIANAVPPGQGAAKGRPFTFGQAAAFQWVNPKGWMAAIAVTTQFATPAKPYGSAAIIAAAFLLAGLSATASWAAFGQAIGRMLHTPGRLRAFNIVMALALVGFLVVVLLKSPT
jgi:threonine/homoserine/homoserine lactone efflux protein